MDEMIVGRSRYLLLQGTMAPYGALDCVNQLVLRHRFDEEVLGLDCLAAAGQEHDRQSAPEFDQAALQFRTAETGHLDIELDAACASIARQSLQEELGRFIGCDRVADRTQ